MEQPGPDNINHRESELRPRDTSREFLTMPGIDFFAFLRTLKNEPALSIEIDWPCVGKTRQLKAFLEDFNSRRGVQQKRHAAIRVTDEEYKQELNVFASGVRRIRVENHSKDE